MKSRTQIIAITVLTFIAGAAVANFGNQQRRGSRPLPSVVQLTVAEENHILYMREEEKLARDVYLTLYEQWGAEIFANISESEQQHMDAIENLITRNELVDPVVNNAVGEFTNSDFAELYDELVKAGEVSLEEALKVGITIEELDIVDLQDALKETEMLAVERVFQNLLNGSYNHLDAFQRALDADGTQCPAQLGIGECTCSADQQCNMTGLGNGQAGNGRGQAGNGVNQNCNSEGQGNNDTNQNGNNVNQNGNGTSPGGNSANSGNNNGQGS